MSDPAHQSRCLLRHLRDLDLHGERIAVAPRRALRVEGCISRDAPIEGGVRYLLAEEGVEHILELRLGEEGLDLCLDGRQRRELGFLPATGASVDRELLARTLRSLIQMAWAA